MIPEPPGIVSRPFARTLSIFRALLKLAPTGWAVLKNMLKSTAQLENTGRRGTRTNSETPASVLTAGGSDALGHGVLLTSRDLWWGQNTSSLPG